MTQQIILNIDLFDLWEPDYIRVKLLDKKGNKHAIVLQTYEGLYRSEMGCEAFNEDHTQLNSDFYESVDFNEVIKSVENYIQTNTQIKKTEFKYNDEPIFLIKNNLTDKVYIALKNKNFINEYTSSSISKYKHIIGQHDYEEIWFSNVSEAHEELNFLFDFNIIERLTLKNI